jgi:hypothetical protein
MRLRLLRLLPHPPTHIAAAFRYGLQCQAHRHNLLGGAAAGGSGSGGSGGGGDSGGGDSHKGIPLFSCPAYTKLTSTVVSTSNCGNPSLQLFGFG